MIATEFLLRPEVERRHQRQSAVITGVIIALLILLMLFWVLSKPDPKFPPEGILISMGTTESGFGPVEPSQQEEAATPPPMPDHSPDVVEDVVVTQDVNTVAVSEKERKKESQAKEPVNEPVKEPVKEPVQPKVDPKPRNVYNPTQSTSQTTSTSQGQDPMSTGNVGQPDGSTESDRMGQTPGLGTSGFSASLGGRGMTDAPTFPKKVRPEQGKIIFEIEVDRSGRVVRVGAILRGSEITDPGMIAEARDLAYKVRFQSSTTAPEIQRGSITITFKY